MPNSAPRPVGMSVPGEANASPGAPAIEASGVTRVYGATAALAGADLTVRRGEIHALLGENGAGKSTLVRILAGVERADGGSIKIFGDELGTDIQTDTDPTCAFIHQDLALFQTLSVAANIALGSGFKRRFGMIDERGTLRAAEEVLKRLGMSFSARAIVGELSLADQTAVAIARALSQGVRLIVLDEPTAYLEAKQVRSVLALLRRLRNDGVACLLITHRASDVLETCDCVTVLREGHTVAERPVAGLTEDELVRLISGHVPHLHTRSTARATARPVLELRDARGAGIGPISLTVGEGEIVGLCGLADAGTSAVGRIAFGIDRLDSGEMLLLGEPVSHRDPARAMAAGVSYVPGDRRNSGLAESLTACENLFLRTRRRWYRPISRTDEHRRSQAMMEGIGVDPSVPEYQASAFSGGNQQKIVLAKWLQYGPKLLVLNEPTAGVDLGAKADIHSQIARASVEQKFGVLLISSDFTEIAQLADRVYVMYHQRVLCELDAAQATPEALISYAYGRQAA